LSYDKKQALVGTTFPSDEASAALTQNPGIIYIIEQYIKHEIFISRMLQHYKGSSMGKLKKVYQEVVRDLP
jgi:hypothetical protein